HSYSTDYPTCVPIASRTDEGEHPPYLEPSQLNFAGPAPLPNREQQPSMQSGRVSSVPSAGKARPMCFVRPPRCVRPSIPIENLRFARSTKGRSRIRLTSRVLSSLKTNRLLKESPVATHRDKGS